MIKSMYPFWSAVTACVLAQFLKPFCYYIGNREWRLHLMVDSGEFPSSHSATVSALAMAVGLHEHFSSSLFAVSLVLAAIVIYDAANVRYYSGQNARVTQKLISDIQELLDTQLDDPVYAIKLKTVLGHKWFEIIGGILIGIAVALFFHFVL